MQISQQWEECIERDWHAVMSYQLSEETYHYQILKMFTVSMQNYGCCKISGEKTTTAKGTCKLQLLPAQTKKETVLPGCISETPAVIF